jgi:hypothetical protein
MANLARALNTGGKVQHLAEIFRARGWAAVLPELLIFQISIFIQHYKPKVRDFERV